MEEQDNKIDELELQKRRSHTRLFKAFIILDILLFGYLIYSLIMLFTHL